jgi:uncharacterized protein (TIGR03437 family)
MASTPTSQLLSRLPLRFEADRTGRWSHDVTYMAHGGTFDLVLAPAESWLETRGGRVRMALRGVNPSGHLEPLDRLPGAANYFLGSEKNWKTDVTGYGRVRSAGVYPGIDLVFHGDGGRLEYDFIVGPHSDPGAIQLDFSGQRGLRVDSNGDLVISTSGHAGNDEIRWKRPEIYQDVEGRRTPVAGNFVVSHNRVRFEIATYDRSRELVIDPTLAYSTYLGGPNNEVARGIGVDGAGNVYVAGDTQSNNLPTVSAVQPNFGGSAAVNSFGDAFIAKFSPAGTLLYLTYLGGSANDAALALAVDKAGNAYVAGCTTSTDFPTKNPYQSKFGGMGGDSIVLTGDAFVAKLNPSGNQLLYSTYLGGSLDDIATAIAIDANGNAYVAGATVSTNFPVSKSTSPYQQSMAGVGGEPIRPNAGQPAWEPGDAFVVRLDPNGQLLYGTYFGGNQDDAAFAIALDASGNVYIGGSTLSMNLPTTAGAISQTFGGVDIQNFFMNTGDGFVAEFDPTLATLRYGTYFGGIGDDTVAAIAVDSSGNIYMTGSTSTPNLTTSKACFQPRYAGYYTLPYLIEQLYGDAFVAKINPSSKTPIYLSYLGGSQNDGGTAIAVDSAGNAYVTGFTDSTDFPMAGNPLQPVFGGDGGQGVYIDYGDAFLAVVNPTGTALLYSSFYGGNADDEGNSLAVDSSGNVYIAGNTLSTNLKTTSNALQKSFGGFGGVFGLIPARGDAFFAEFSGLTATGPSIALVANAEGEATTIGPNTWVEIKGSNLAPPGVSSPACAPGYCWQASDFVNNQLPTGLQGVSVTLNGEKAFVYFISAGQINILTPPDLAAGPVTVQVNNNGSLSNSFTAQAQTLAESFFVLNGGPYIVAAHLSGTFCTAPISNVCLVGPSTLYPGYSTPAQRNETIVIYANGFGSTTTQVVSGVETQSGSLPTLPVIQIGNATANVTFAGLISPGLYQFNVIVPATVSSGDNSITATYNGQKTQSGTLITIQ